MESFALVAADSSLEAEFVALEERFESAEAAAEIAAGSDDLLRAGRCSRNSLFNRTTVFNRRALSTTQPSDRNTRRSKDIISQLECELT